MKKFAPKKSIGQHFLHDKNISKKIVEFLSIDKEDVVVEIGPGTGALTEYLLKKDIKLFAYEIDKRSIEHLQIEYKSQIPQKLQIIEDDFLNSDLFQFKTQTDKKIKVIGNIPYYITSPILFHLCKYSNVIDTSVLMMQKEIYQRLVAKPKTKEYGILSLLANLFFDVEEKFDVPPSCFFPPPKVMSTVVKINFNKKVVDYNTAERFQILSLIKTLFNQRRKIINNTIQSYLSINKIDLQQISSNVKFVQYSKMRPEELSIQDYLILYDLINSKVKK